MFVLAVGVVCLLFGHSAMAIPKPDEAPAHHGLDHLAHTNHLQDAHDAQYDHEQFLGEDQAKTFDQLAPEESRRRLGYEWMDLYLTFSINTYHIETDKRSSRRPNAEISFHLKCDMAGSVLCFGANNLINGTKTRTSYVYVSRFHSMQGIKSQQPFHRWLFKPLNI